MPSPISSIAHAASLAAVGEKPGRTQSGNAVAQSHAALMARQKANFHSAIVESSLSVSIESGNQSLALLYRSAIDRLNEALAPELGENAIETAASQDNTPEATAARIVSLSTGLFDAYKAQHPGEDEATLLDQFVTLIRDGFEQGYGDARNILDGLKVLEGDVATGIERTHELVLKGFDDFVASHTATSADAP